MLIDGFALADRPFVTRTIRLYGLTLNRVPDPGGLQAYVQSLSDGRSLESLAAIFIQSDEFRAQHGVTDDFRERLSRGMDARTGADRSTAALVADRIEADEAEGHASLLPTMLSGGTAFADGPAYPWWADARERISSNQMRAIEAMRPALARGPLISLVALVDDPDLGHLREMIQSVLTQLHEKLELILVVGRPGRQAVASYLEQQNLTDPRLKLVRRSWRSGRAGGFNDALRVAGGDFIGPVDPGDRLAATTTLELAHAALSWPEAKILFTDEDAVSPDGVHHAPRLKSDWDPDRMLVENQPGRLCVFRTDLLRRIGGMRPGAAGNDEEFDLTRRAASAVAPAEIRHIPLVLYHRRAPLHDAGAKRAPGQAAGGRRVLRPLPAGRPLVSIIVPTRDRADLLGPCVEGLLGRTAYPRIELIVVDNGSREAGTLALLGSLSSQGRAKVLAFDGPFNWPAVNNRGVAASRGDVVLLLNNDTETVNADWLDEMVAHALRPDVGIVGAKLLYPGGTVQHAGMILAPNGACRHAFRHAAADDAGYLDQLAIVRTVSAVTGACMALRRQVFDQVGGLEEHAFPVTNGDIDLCLRIQQHGYRVVWTPFAQLWHKELSTRGADDTPEKVLRAGREQACLVGKWGDALREDPYWNPNLEVTERGAVLAVPSRARRAWE